MPEISRFYGIVIRMFFDDHNPPHFHVEYQDFEATINILDGTIKGELPRRALKLVYEWLDLHEQDLIDNWNNMQEAGTFKKITPLK